MVVAGDDVTGRDAGGPGEPQHGAQQPSGRVVDLGLGNGTGVDEGPEVGCVVHPERHLDVDAGVGGGFGVPDPVDPVGDYEPVEPPAFLQDVGEQGPVVPAPLAVQRVVGAHHARGALVDAETA